MTQLFTWSPRARIRVRVVAIIVVAASVGLTSLLFAGPRHALAIAPNAVVDLSSTTFEAGSPVSTTFRITNLIQKPVLVKEFVHSCTCIATEVDGGKAPPFLLGPGESAEFVPRTIVQPRREPVQTFKTVIESESEGKPLPGLTASMRVRVEDGLMALPESITALDLPIERTKGPEVFLVNYSAAKPPAEPSVAVSDPDVIKAKVVPRTSSKFDKDGFKTHYALQTEITPKEGQPSVAGWVKLSVGDRVISNIPVRCSFKKPYRLSLDTVEIRGRLGETVTQKIFYEASDPAWRPIACVSNPGNLQVTIEPFDKDCDVIKVTGKVLRADPHAGQRPDPRLDFAVTGSDHKLSLPIQYVIAE
jgi:hypothetical protein